MSIQKVNHNVIKFWDGTDGALTISTGATPTKTSPWVDVSGLTDKVISYEVDSGGTIDANVLLQVSPQHYYELNNKTCTTDDYVELTIVDAHTAAILVRVDASDLDDLQRPFRSCRAIIDNDESTHAITDFSVWIEGWS